MGKFNFKKIILDIGVQLKDRSLYKALNCFCGKADRQKAFNFIV